MKTCRRKWLARWLAACIAVVLGMGMCAGLPVSAAYENTYTNTGNQRADIVAVAKTQIGYHEGSLEGTTNSSNNYTKYNVWNGKIEGGYRYAWCHAFVSWCANQAGIGTDIVPKTAGTSTGRSFFVNQGTYRQSAANGGSYVPQAGDIIYYGSGSSPSHVGIVSDCDGSTVYTIEGNYSNKVGTRAINLSNSYIIGYGVPNYKGVVPPKPAPTLTVSTGNSSIETTFSWNTVEGATEYDVKIWKGTVWEGDAYLVEWGASNPYSVVLPEGTYQAYVDARFGSDMQMSNIVEFTVKAGCKLNVEVGNTSAETKFTWNDVNNATGYDVKIWKGKAWEGDPYLVEWGASNPYSVILPEGTYQAYVDTRFGSDMQMSNIVEFTVKAGCKLNVEVGNTSAETKFTWNDVNNATGYDVKIWKGKAWEGDPYLVEWGASNPYSVILPEGTYQAYVDTRFGSDMQMSNIVEFTVKAGCKLNVEVGNTSAETKFTWNDVNNATGYDVKIWKGKVWEGDPYLVEWGASNPYSVVLPEGTYQAYVDTRFGSDMQMSNVVEFTIKAGCKLNVEVGNTSTETKFTWNDVNNATGYDVKIWKGKVWEGDPYLVEWGASNPYSVVLPEGTYQAYVDTRFGSDMQMSNIVTFNVTKAKIQIGDLNSDNTLTTADAVLLQRYLLQERTLTQSQWQTADLNADGTVNGFDLALLRQKLVG